MPKNEDGEFELILGNRQLLSVFFIVVVLLGVFFTMGYIVGRNSPGQEVASVRKTDTKPIVVDSEPSPTSTPPASTSVQPPPMESPKPAEPVTPKPAPKEVAKAKAPEPPKPAPAPAPAPPPAAASGPEQPPSGQTFLQLAATTQRE